METTDHDILIRLDEIIESHIRKDIHEGARTIFDQLSTELNQSKVERARVMQVLEGLGVTIREIKGSIGADGTIAKAITALQLELRVNTADIRSIREWQKPVNWFITLVGSSIVLGILGLLWALLTCGAEILIHR